MLERMASWPSVWWRVILNRSFTWFSHRQEQRGTLRLKKHLDYERPGEQRFNLTIKVEDMQYSSLLHCTLEVEDCNDHMPVFIPHFLQLPAIREDVAPGTSVASVAASDLDSGLNREITYSIAPESDPDHLFSVDQLGWSLWLVSWTGKKSHSITWLYLQQTTAHHRWLAPQLSRWLCWMSTTTALSLRLCMHQ